MRRRLFAIPVLCLTLSLAAGAGAACPAGAKCLGGAKTERATGETGTGLPGAVRPVAVSEPAFEPGDILPRGAFQVLTNTRWHGLPPSDGSFWYYKVNYSVLKVDARSMEVLENVTHDARRVRY